MEIDWSKEPDGFPLWLEGIGTHRRHSGWYRRAGDVFEHETTGQFRAVREGQFFTVHEKPEVSVWQGEGLPPVGRCELRLISSGGNWHEADIKFASRNVVVWDWVGEPSANGLCTGYAHTVQFRPIRTPEQIAAEIREKAIEAMLEAANCIGNPWRERFGTLYDAGYRKFEITDES